MTEEWDYFNRGGELCDQDEVYVACRLTLPDGDCRYKVALYNNILYDPELDTGFLNAMQDDFRMKYVDYPVFEHYLRYLRGDGEQYYRIAQRESHNG